MTVCVCCSLHHVLLESPHEFVTPLILHPACSVLALMIKAVDLSRIRRAVVTQ
jgi:hypothetical protein